MKHTLISRKKNPSFFSIETVFLVISAELKGEIEINHVELPFTSRGILSILLNLVYLKWAIRNKQSFFHITGDIHYSILALPADKTILTIHDLIFLHSHKGIKRSFLKWIYLDLPVKKARYITTISEKSKQEIINHTGCDALKIIVIPNPVDPSFVYKEKPFNADKPVVLFIGVKPNKNLEKTILSLSGLNIHLRIIGKPSSQQLILLNQHHIDFSFDCNISKVQLATEYQHCDVVLFPSTYEGFGLPVIEGFAAGRPVITSDISPMKEISNGAALLVDPQDTGSIRDAVVKLINDQSLRSDLVSNGLEVVKAYRPEVIAGKYKELWKKVEDVYKA